MFKGLGHLGKSQDKGVYKVVWPQIDLNNPKKASESNAVHVFGDHHFKTFYLTFRTFKVEMLKVS